MRLLDEQFLQTTVPQMNIISHGLVREYKFSIDSRTLRSGEIFVALTGSQVDGHQFIMAAIEQDAAGIIVQENKKELLSKLSQAVLKKLFVATVPDTLEALISWASAWRAQFDIPVIGITGSMGKTTTKEMLSAIFTLNGMEHIASYGNQNTKIGIALNLLRLNSSHKAAIVEMGISQRGEMAELASLVRPTTAVITSVGHCHMEGLGSLADIALEKRDIFKFFTEKSIGIINGDMPLLANVGYIHPVVKFGSKTINQIQARKVQIGGAQTNFVLKLYKNKHQISIPKAHEGIVYNALAAAAVAYLHNVPADIIVRAIQKPISVEGRFQVRRLTNHNGTLIDDCYNANPESMKAALLAFEKYETSAQKIAVLGDMLELGVNSPFWHRQLGRFLRKVPSLKKVILVGEMVKWTKKTMPVTLPVEIFANWQEALKKLEIELKTESVVLLKGSHGMKLGNIVEALTGELQKPVASNAQPAMRGAQL